MNKQKVSVKYFILLHVILFLYSLGGIASKTAAQQEFLSLQWCFFYGLVLLNLFVYAILWQQILKKMPLTTAFANKSITIVWSMVWGSLIFNEEITLKKIVACVLIFIGVYMVVTNDE